MCVGARKQQWLLRASAPKKTKLTAVMASSSSLPRTACCCDVGCWRFLPFSSQLPVFSDSVPFSRQRPWQTLTAGLFMQVDAHSRLTDFTQASGWASGSVLKSIRCANVSYISFSFSCASSSDTLFQNSPYTNSKTRHCVDRTVTVRLTVRWSRLMFFKQRRSFLKSSALST